jgi:plastocyanin
MRYFGLALLASATVLSACGGAADKPADSTPAMQAEVPPATAMPITGDTTEVKMVGDGTIFKFEPAEVTIKTGDGIKFVFVSGGPHNVQFPPAGLPADVRAQLKANMPNQMGELTSPPFMSAGESYVVSFGGVKPGKYIFDCPLHVLFNMKGAVTVQ